LQSEIDPKRIIKAGGAKRQPVNHCRYDTESDDKQHHGNGARQHICVSPQGLRQEEIKVSLLQWHDVDPENFEYTDPMGKKE
jgi:hypothetical protein